MAMLVTRCLHSKGASQGAPLPTGQAPSIAWDPTVRCGLSVPGNSHGLGQPGQTFRVGIEILPD